ncbi:MAG: hypothetical protein HY999_00395 [Nitrospinae bacterium]|nr:hypothetical protein [Nitrospinota bacterium]
MEEIRFAIYSALLIGGVATLIYLLERKSDEGLFQKEGVPQKYGRKRPNGEIQSQEGLFEKEKAPQKGEVKKKIVIWSLMILFWGALSLFLPWNINELAYLLLGACMIWGVIYLYLQKSQYDKAQYDKDQEE